MFAAGAICNVAAGQRRRALEEKLEQAAQAAPEVLAPPRQVPTLLARSQPLQKNKTRKSHLALGQQYMRKGAARKKTAGTT